MKNGRAMRAIAVAMYCLVSAGGCAGDRSAADSAGARVSERGAIPDGRNDTTPGGGDSSVRITRQPADTVAAQHETWSLAALSARLRGAGLTADVAGGTVRQPFMSVAGTLLLVGDAEVQAYIYADALARARDTDQLDTARVAPPNTMITWTAPPTLVIDNNLALIVLARDRALARRIRNAVRVGD